MSDNNVVATSLSDRTARGVLRHTNISTVVQELHYELTYVSFKEFVGAKRQRAFSPSRLGTVVTFIATLIVALPAVRLAAAERFGECFVREGKKPIINKEDTSTYERKLFLTPDEIGRYVFLTNAPHDGDRSAALYRARHKKGSLPGNYWVSVTEAEDSVRGHTRDVRVRRFDAPVPASTANVVHDLWLAVLHQSGANDEAIPSAPTGVLSLVTASGGRLKAVTVSFEENSPCLAVLGLGESLIDYAKLPVAKRPQEAAKIEKESRRLLKRMSQKKGGGRRGQSVNLGKLAGR